MNAAASLAAPLTIEQIAMIQSAVAEVASSGGGFGVVSIVVERGEARRIQQTKDRFLRPRPEEHPPPLAPCSVG